MVPWLAVPWPAGCRDRERVPAAEPGAAAGRWWSRRPNLPDLTGRRLPVMIVIGLPRERLLSFTDRDAEFARAAQPALAMIAIGRPREGLSSFTDRGAWLHGVARGPVVGSALAGRLPGSRATASGTRRRCRQGAIETPSLPELRGRLPAMIVIGRPRQRLTSFNDRGAWLHGVGLGPVVGSALAGRLPGSRASTSG